MRITCTPSLTSNVSTDHGALYRSIGQQEPPTQSPRGPPPPPTPPPLRWPAPRDAPKGGCTQCRSRARPRMLCPLKAELIRMAPAFGDVGSRRLVPSGDESNAVGPSRGVATQTPYDQTQDLSSNCKAAIELIPKIPWRP